MRKPKYYRIKVTYKDADGNEWVTRYTDTREEFEGFTAGMLERKGFTVVAVEDIKQPVEYIR